MHFQTPTSLGLKLIGLSHIKWYTPNWWHAFHQLLISGAIFWIVLTGPGSAAGCFFNQLAVPDNLLLFLPIFSPFFISFPFSLIKIILAIFIIFWVPQRWTTSSQTFPMAPSSPSTAHRLAVCLALLLAVMASTREWPMSSRSATCTLRTIGGEFLRWKVICTKIVKWQLKASKMLTLECCIFKLAII